jgi:hypothetical protein
MGAGLAQGGRSDLEKRISTEQKKEFLIKRLQKGETETNMIIRGL